jgi:hypothetical protein
MLDAPHHSISRGRVAVRRVRGSARLPRTDRDAVQGLMREVRAMTRAQLRALSFVWFVMGLSAYPVATHYLFPWANSVRLPDGRLVSFSVTQGSWLFPAGLVAAIVFLCLSAWLFWQSFKISPRDP